jgi:hypothetical protein
MQRLFECNWGADENEVWKHREPQTRLGWHVCDGDDNKVRNVQVGQGDIAVGADDDKQRSG